MEAPAKIVVERLSPDTRGDYLAFFDHERGPAFSDNPEWARCYCQFYRIPRALDWKAFTADHPALAGRVEMEVVGVAGHPATELVEQSREAALLVLGHRGRGAIASTLLGSVGLSCVLHAHCPVTIVRPTSAGDDAAAPAVAAATPAV